jgi:membrane-associated phospholipid phosphatase
LSLIGIVSAGYLAGELTGSTSLRQTALLAAESLLITELFVQSGKMTFGRARPYALEGALSFHPFTLHGKWQSFPSGHSAAAWAVATTVAGRTQAGYLKALLYGLAAGVSVSRVILDKHFSSDVIASSLLGYYLGRKIGHRASPTANRPGQPACGLSIAPGLISFNFNYQF